MLFHLQMNNPAWPDAQPWENYLFLIAAVVIVILNRRSMLHRAGAVTDVLMPAANVLSRQLRPEHAGQLPRPPVGG